ncbi:MAG: hypothetical protein ACX93U_07005 [Salipiger thiooxidans]|uniref:hypothetical protein n=1 Tax=Salipiger thiooxidans TaxID=282683 RepID=UPI001CFA9F36|nr:hypothetical protein [Salipiger thiooxidans]MBR9836719.1 hypothetical protein [Paracoccaceae bacterium]
MSQIEELQSRMSRALDRIAKGVEALSAAPPPGPVPEPQPEAAPGPAPAVDAGWAEAAEEAAAEAAAEIARLRDALDEEKMANSQLEERVKTLRSRLEEAQAAPAAPAVSDAALMERVEAQRESMAALDAEMQRLKTANDMLRKTCEEMRGALQDNVGEPHLVNKAMLAELEALRAARAAEEAEIRAVLGAMAPLLSEAAGDDVSHGDEETVQ